MSDAELIQQLRATRDDYETELAWHRFLIDAYTGTGGFAGAVKQPPTGYLGWAAEVYGDNALQSYGHSEVLCYLDRYPREDSDKFARRKAVAHYPNHAEAILDLLLSFVLKREMTIENRPARIDAWTDDVNGRGTTWDKQRNTTIVPRAALLGWTPQLIDADAAEDGATAADTAGIAARSMPLFPANMLDWQCDESGEFDWVKLRLDYTRRQGPLDPAVKEEHYILWTRTSVHKYIVRKDDNGDTIEDLGEQVNKAGMVPIVIWRNKPCPDDPVRGLGMLDGVVGEIRRLFNLLSELDEHMRSQVFAVLQVPDGVKELILGTDNAVQIPEGAKHEYKWLSPDTGPAATYETRIENTIAEIYRLARTESDSGQRVSDASGIARGYAFEKTNRRLGDFATNISDGELRAYKVLALVLGMPEGAVDGTRAVAPTDFKVEDLATAIENAIQAVSLDLGPTADARIKQRVIDKLLPGLSRADRADIDQEIEDVIAAGEQAAAEMAEIQAAAEGGDTEDAEDPEENPPVPGQGDPETPPG